MFKINIQYKLKLFVIIAFLFLQKLYIYIFIELMAKHILMDLSKYKHNVFTF